MAIPIGELEQKVLSVLEEHNIRRQHWLSYKLHLISYIGGKDESNKL